MERILVPTDFSSEAGYALDAAVMIARKCETDLTLLHVIEAPQSGGSFNVEGEVSYGNKMDDIFVIKMMEKIKGDFEDLIANPDYEGVNMNYDVKVGNTYKNINDMIAGANCNMIVMGTQGSSGLDEVFIGSNTEKVVRNATCPVLSLKSAIDESAFDNIAFATNMGDNQGGIVNELKEFQNKFGSKLHIVRINTPNNFQSDRITKEKMKEYAAEHGIENYTLNIFNDPVEGDGIMSFAQDIDAGLIAMATHGRTGLSHLLSGSIAEDIVNHAKKPVLTFNIKN